MKLTQEQAEKLKTLKTMEEVKAFFTTERVQLSPEDLDKITGGWSFFDPVKNALKDVGNWVYDNMIDPAVDGLVDAGKTVVDGVVDAGKTVVDAAFEGLGIHSEIKQSLIDKLGS